MKKPRDFHATLRPGGGYTLFCRVCGTREEFSNLKRVDDIARVHAQWWHNGPIRVPTEVFGMKV